MTQNIRALSSFLQGLKRKSNASDEEPRQKINLRNLSAAERANKVESNNNMPGYSANERPLPNDERYKCQVCNVFCTSDPNLEQHKKGRRHLLAIGEFDKHDEEESFLSEDEKVHKTLLSLEENKMYFDLFRDVNERITFKCLLCNVNIQAADVKVHCSGRRHSENVAMTTDNHNPIDMEIEEDEGSDKKVGIASSNQFKIRNSRPTHYKHYSSMDEHAQENLEKLKQILDQRENILDLKERRLILREAECAKREEEVAQREVKLRLEEVKLLSAVNNKELSKNDMLLKRLHGIENSTPDQAVLEHLNPSEKKYYSELVVQKKEIMIAYNTITEKSLLTMEERLAKSKLKIALEDIQMAVNNLTRNKGDVKCPTLSGSSMTQQGMANPPSSSRREDEKSGNLSPQSTPTGKSPGNALSKEDLKKQMEEKLLQEMNKGSLAKLAKIIAHTPSMKAVLEKIEKNQENATKPSPRDEDRNKNQPNERNSLPVQKKPLLSSPPRRPNSPPRRVNSPPRRSSPQQRPNSPPRHPQERYREEHRHPPEHIERREHVEILREREERHRREMNHHERERHMREHVERRGPLLEHPPQRRPLLEHPRLEHHHHHERRPESHHEEFRRKDAPVYDEEFFVGKRYPPPEREGSGLLPKPVPPPMSSSSNPIIRPDTGKYGIRPHPMSNQKAPLLPRPYDAPFY